MIDSHIYANIAECCSQIESDFKVKLAENVDNPIVLMRGENYPYQKTESSMKRFLTADDGKTMKAFYYVSPFIDFEEIYAEFHSSHYGLDEEEGTGFLQHYGFPTDLFDLSPSFDTARFFAAHGRSDEPVGIIGVFDAEEIDGYFTVTDLSRHPFALRPREQCAYAARPKPGIIDLKDSRCDDLFTSKWYRFLKSSDDLKFASLREGEIYPTEEEIAHFFSRDIDEFFRSHSLYDEMTDEQRHLVQEKLATIRGQLKRAPKS